MNNKFWQLLLPYSFHILRSSQLCTCWWNKWVIWMNWNRMERMNGVEESAVSHKWTARQSVDKLREWDLSATYICHLWREEERLTDSSTVQKRKMESRTHNTQHPLFSSISRKSPRTIPGSTWLGLIPSQSTIPAFRKGLYYYDSLKSEMHRKNIHALHIQGRTKTWKFEIVHPYLKWMIFETFMSQILKFITTRFHL